MINTIEHLCKSTDIVMVLASRLLCHFNNAHVTICFFVNMLCCKTIFHRSHVFVAQNQYVLTETARPFL